VRFLASSSLALLLVVAASCVAAACGDDDPPGTTPPNQVRDAGTEASARPLCVDGKKTADYPPEPHEMRVLGVVPPDVAFDAVEGRIAIKDFFDPCAARPRLLVIRSGALWCGPCFWQAAHTKRWLLDDPRFQDRLTLIDLVIADEDNVPATTTQMLGRWAAKMDVPPGPGGQTNVKVVVDPSYTFGRALSARSPLPAFVFVDTRTMKIVSTMIDPPTESLLTRLAIEIADIDKTPRPPLTSPTMIDERFTENQMDLIRGMKLVDAPPPDPTNEYADVPAAAAFGKLLFSDNLLSPAGVSCAKCHDPALELNDGVPQSIGVTKVDRNSPGIALAAHSRWQFWDGRADTLWMQALGPPENSAEIGSSRLYIAHQIAQRHAAQYGAVFGAKYPLPDLTGLPPSGKPGDAAYDALAQADKDKVTRIYVNVGKAIAAFERAIRVQPNALDRYIDGDLNALNLAQKEGLFVFMKNGCGQCHWGPRLTNDAFHVLRFETGAANGKADEGRITSLPNLAAGEFIASSKWSDNVGAAKPFAGADSPLMLGAFKTPTLRGIPKSAPYGHGGTLATLADIAHHYGQRGLEHADSRAIGTTEQWVPQFDTGAEKQLVPFLEVLTATPVLP
jgi:cytochrome c peroxidase